LGDARECVVGRAAPPSPDGRNHHFPLAFRQRGAGPNIPLPPPATATQFLPEDAAVVVQLVNSDSEICWETRYSAPTAKNTATSFKDGIP
jgi:hypothetical protein